ncbi:MAG: cysteine dioxygenase family protein [Phycisphaerales bacterium]|nr:cysteine dioxygenase family protein [Phycisphaerales bacterium]
MVVAHSVPILDPLFEYLDGLTERAPIDELQTRLESLDIDVANVAEFVRFHPEQYLRNLVRKGPHYHVLVICWRSGQRSPIHNHAQSTCGLRVMRGIATETVFDTSPSGLIKAIYSHELPAGHVAATQDGDIHQVSNLEAPGNDLITLHIYSPPLLRMDTYSLLDRHIGEFRPIILGHEHGSGI